MKLKYILCTALVICASSIPLIVPTTTAQIIKNAATKVKDMQATAYVDYLQGDKARDEERADEAIEHYTKALLSFREIQKIDPNFQKQIVSYRITYCENQIETLNRNASAPAGAQEAEIAKQLQNFKEKYATLLAQNQILQRELNKATSNTDAGQLEKQGVLKRLEEENQQLKDSIASMDSADGAAKEYAALQGKYDNLRTISEKLLTSYKQMKVDLEEAQAQSKAKPMIATADPDLKKQLAQRDQALLTAQSALEKNKQERDEMNNQLTELRKQLATQATSLSQQKTASQSSLKELQDKLNMATAQSKKFEDMETRYNKQLAALQAEKMAAEANLSQLKDQVKKSTEMSDSAQRLANQHSEKAEKLTSENSKLQNKLETLEQDLSARKTQEKELSKAKVASAKEIQKVTSDNERLSESLAEQAQTLAAITAAKQTLETKADDLAKSNSQLAAERDEALNMVSIKEKDVSENIKPQFDLLVSENARTKMMVEQKDKELLMVKTNATDAEQRAAQLAAQLNAVKEANKAKEQQVGELSQTVASLSADNQVMQERIGQVEANYKITMGEFEKSKRQMMVLSASNVQLKEREESGASEREKLATENSRLASELDVLTSSTIELDKARDMANQELAQLKAKNNLLTEQVAEKESAIKMLSEKSGTTDDRLIATQQMIAELKAGADEKTKRLTEELASQQAKAREMAGQQDLLEARANEMATMSSEKARKVTELEQQLAELRTANDTLKTDLSDIRKSMPSPEEQERKKRESQKQLADAQKKADALQEKIDLSAADKEAGVLRLRQMAAKITELEKVATKSRDDANKMAELEQQVSTLRSEKDTLQADLSNTRKRMTSPEEQQRKEQAAQKQLADAQKQAADLKEKLDLAAADKEAGVVRLHQMAAKITELEKMASKNNNVAKKVDDLEQQVTNLRSANDTLEADLVKTRKSMPSPKEQERKERTLQKQLVEAQKQASALQEKLELSAADKEAGNLRLREMGAKINDLENQLSTGKPKPNNEMQEQLAAAQKKASQLQRELTNAQTDRETYAERLRRTDNKMATLERDLIAKEASNQKLQQALEKSDDAPRTVHAENSNDTEGEMAELLKNLSNSQKESRIQKQPIVAAQGTKNAAELARLKNDNQELTRQIAEMAELQKQAMELSSDSQRLQKQLSELKTNANTDATVIASLRKQKSELEQNISRMQKGDNLSTEQTEKITSLQLSNEKLANSINTLKKQAGEAEAATTQSIKDLEQKLADATKQSKQSASLMDQMAAKEKEFQAALSAKNQEVATLRKMSEGLKAGQTNLQKQLAEQDDVKELKKQLSLQQAEIEALNKSMSSGDAEKLALRKENQEFQSQAVEAIAAKDKQINTLKSVVADSTASLDSQKKLHDESIAAHTKLQKQILDLTAEKTVLEEAHSKAIARIKAAQTDGMSSDAKRQDQLARTEQTIRELLQQEATLKKEIEDQATSANKLAQRHAAEIEKITADLLAKNTVAEQQEKQLGEQSQAMAALMEQQKKSVEQQKQFQEKLTATEKAQAMVHQELQQELAGRDKAIAEFKGAISQSEEENSSLSLAVAKLKESLETQQVKADQEVSTLSKQLEATKQRMATLTTESNDATSTLAETKLALEESEKQIITLRAAIDEQAMALAETSKSAADKLELTKTEVDMLGTKLAAAIKERDAQKAELDKTTQQANNLNRQQMSLQKELKLIETQSASQLNERNEALTKATDENRRQKLDINALKTTVATITQGNAELQQQVSTLTSDMTDKLAEKQMAIAMLQEKLVTAQMATDQKTQELGKVQVSLVNLEAKMGEDSSNMTKELSRINLELENAAKTTARFEKEIAEKENAIATLENKLADEASLHAKSMEELSIENAAKSEQLTMATKTTRELESRVKQLQNANNVQNADLEKMRRALAAAEKSQSDMTTRIASISKEKELAMKEMSESIALLQSGSEAMAKADAEKETTLKSLKEQLTLATTQATQLQEQLASISKEKELAAREMSQSIALLQAESEAMIKATTEKDATLKSLNEQLTLATTQATQLQEQLASISKEKELAAREMSQSIALLQAESEAMIKATAEKDATLADQAKQLAKSDALASDLQSQLAEMNKKHDLSNRDMSQSTALLQIENKDLSQQIALKEEALLSIEQQMISMKKANVESIEKLTDVNNKQELTIGQLNQDLAAATKKQEASRTALIETESQLKKNKVELTTHLANATEMEEKISQLNAQLDSAGKQNQQFKKTLQENKLAMAKADALFNQEMTALNSTATENQQRQASLTNQINTITAELENTRSALAASLEEKSEQTTALSEQMASLSKELSDANRKAEQAEIDQRKTAEMHEREITAVQKKNDALTDTIDQLTKRNALASEALNTSKAQAAKLQKSSMESTQALANEKASVLAELNGLQTEYSTATNTIQALKTDLALQQKKMALTQKSHAEVTEEVVWLRSEREKALIDRRTLSNRQKEMATQSASMSEQLQEELMLLEKENTRLANDLNNEKSTAKKYAESIQNMQLKHRELLVQKELAQEETTLQLTLIDRLKAEVNQAREEREKLANTLVEKEALYAEATNKMQKEVTDARKVSATQSQENNVLQDRLAQTEKSLSNLSKQVDAEASVNGQTVAALQSELNTSSNKVQNLSKEIDKLKQANSQMAEQSEQEINQILATTKLARSELLQLKKENELQMQANTRLTEKVTRIANIENEKADAMKTITDLQHSFAAIQRAKDEEIKKQNDLIADLKKIQENAAGRYEALSVQTDRLKAANQLATGKMETYQAEITALKAQAIETAMNLGADLKMAQRDIVSKQKELDTRDQLITKLQSGESGSGAMLNEKLAAATTREKAATEKMKAMAMDNQQALVVLQNKVATSKQALDQTTKELKATQQQLLANKAEMDHLMAGRQREGNTNQQATSQMQNHVDTISKQMKSAQAEAAALKERTISQQGELDRAQKEVTRLQAEVLNSTKSSASMQESLATAELASVSLKQQLIEAETKQETLMLNNARMNEQLIALQQQLANSPRNMAPDGNQSTDTVTGLQAAKTQIAALSNEKGVLESKLAAREKSYTEIVARSEELNKAFSHAKKQLEDMKSGSSEEVVDLRKQNKFMKESLDQALKQSTESRTQVEKLTEDLGQLNQQHKELIEENSAMTASLSQNEASSEELIEAKKNQEIKTREAMRDLSLLEQKYAELVRKDRANIDAADKLAAAVAMADSAAEKLRRRDVEVQRLQTAQADQKAQATAVADGQNARIAELKQSHKEALDIKDDEYAKLLKMITDQTGPSKEELAALEKTAENAKAQAASLQSTMKEQSLELASLRELNTKVAQQNQDLAAKNIKLGEEKRMAIKTTLENSRKTMDELRAGQEMLKKQLLAQANEKVAETAKLNAKIEQLSTAKPSAESEKERRQLAKRVVDLEATMATKEQEIETLAQKLTANESGTNARATMLAKKLSETESSLERQAATLNDYKEEVIALRSKAESMDTGVDKTEINDLRAQAAQIKTYETRMLEAIEQKNVAQTNLKTLGKAIEDIRKKNLTADTKYDSLTKELALSKARIAQFAELEGNWKRDRVAIEGLQKQILEQKIETDRFRNVNAELANTVQQEITKSAKLTAQINELKNTKTVDPEMAAKLKSIAEENNRLTRSVAAMDVQMATLREKAAAQSTASSKMEGLMQENSRLSSELETTEAKLIESDLRVQDLVVQQQEVLARLKRLLSVSN